MADGLGKRLSKGIVAIAYSQVVNIVLQVGSVPLFLHYWGKVQFGEWLLLSTIPNYFAISDLGFASAAGNEMTMLVARNDKDGALEVYQSSWLLISMISLIIFCLAVVCLIFLPVEQWMRVSLSHRMFATIISVLILQMILWQQIDITRAGYRCDGHFAPAAVYANTLRLVEFFVSAIIVSSHGGLLDVAIGGLATRLLGVLFIAGVLRRFSPWLYFGYRKASILSLKLIASPAITFTGMTIAQALNLQGTVMVIGITLNPTAVVVFSTTRTLTRILWQMLLTVTNSVWVELSSAFGANNLDLAKKLHGRACQIDCGFQLLAVAFC